MPETVAALGLGTMNVMDDGAIEWPEDEWLRTFSGRASTPDDVCITLDGQRLDSAAKVIAFVAEFNRTHPRGDATG